MVNPSVADTGFPLSSTNCQDGPAKGNAGADFETGEGVGSEEDAQPPHSKAAAPSARTVRMIFITRLRIKHPEPDEAMLIFDDQGGNPNESLTAEYSG